jgi:hypothetical protein
MDADPFGRLLPLPFLKPDPGDVSVTVNAFLSADLLVGPVELPVKIIIVLSLDDGKCSQHTKAVNILIE